MKSDVEQEGCKMRRRIGILSIGAVVLVCASGVLAEDRLAIDDCNDGDVVIVEPNTYTGPGNRDLDFLGKAITVQSTNPEDWAVVEATVIDCEGSGRGFHFHSGETSASVVAGLTISNGNADLGGGIFCEGSGPTITKCLLSGNHASTGGGAMENINASPIVTNCIFTGNSTDFYGGGMDNYNCPSVRVRNCIFAGNSAYWGGGIENLDSSLTITGCTFSGNSAVGYGGGLDSYGIAPSVSNCIFWGNSAPAGAEINGDCSVSYSDVQGGYAGEGNIDAEPLFVDAAGGDYQLLEGSPCFNGGDPNYSPAADEKDIDGQPRVMGLYVDMGADEWTQETVSESARKIPIAYDVDIVVVGGSSGAVAAASAAAEEGAKVFLAASRPYLGQDICGTYRLWLEPGEQANSALARELFSELPSPTSWVEFPFTYEAESPSGPSQQDTNPSSLLSDGAWNSAWTDGVEYLGDVNIIVDLGEKRRVQDVHVMTYQEPNDFEVESLTVYISTDEQRWKTVAFVKKEKLGAGSFIYEAIDISVRVPMETRYVKLLVRKGPLAARIILGEVIIKGTESHVEHARPKTPMQVKLALEEALLSTGVQWLFGCYPTDVLHDDEGNLAGIVMANRSGRQAVKAKTIIDATPRAAVARIAGCSFQPYPSGPQTFRRVVVSEGIQTGDMVEKAEMKPTPLPEAGRFTYFPIDLTAHVRQAARYVKLLVKPGIVGGRILLGEIVVEGLEGPMPITYEADRPSEGSHKDTDPPSMLTDGKWQNVHYQSVQYGGDVNIIADLGEQRNISLTRVLAYQRENGFAVESVIVSISDDKEEWQEVAVVDNELLDIGGGHAIEYKLTVNMEDGSFASFAEAEQVVRDTTWNPKQVDASEFLFQVPPDKMHAHTSFCAAWPGPESISLDAFRPAGIERLYVLGGCADMPREAAEELLRPLALMTVGERIGRAAAADANLLCEPVNIKVNGHNCAATAEGDTRELLNGIRPVHMCLPTVPSDRRLLPVLGQYDVVIVGGGTAGAPAAIGAARQGAKTLVIDYLYGLGGVGTTGLIGKYHRGYRDGFTAEIDEGVSGIGGSHPTGWYVSSKMEWYRREIRRCGAEIWFGVLGCGALVEGNCVKGVVVASPEGRGGVLASVIVDATGNVDIATMAGAQYMFVDAQHAALQGTGLPPRELGAWYSNTDWTFIDDADILDTWRSSVAAKKRFNNYYDLGQLIDTRERRRTVGDFVLSPLDIYGNRTYPDTVARAESDFDSHGFTVHPLFLIKPPDNNRVSAYIPYRCLLPKGLEGIIVTGLGISAHRDSMPIIRMQPDIQRQGYAAGVGGAMAAQADSTPRHIDVRALQEHLVETGNLPASVLTDEDSLPVSMEEVAQAVQEVGEDPNQGIEIVLLQPDDSLQLLQDAYQTADSNEARLTYAQILGLRGDATGSVTLAEAVQSQEWDTGWDFKAAGGQLGRSMSPLDGLIIALGYTSDSNQALGPILEKVEALDPESAFSHHRSIALALETLADSAAAPDLAALLRKPEMSGHAVTDIETAAMVGTRIDWVEDNKRRELSLRELILARALYRCGDYENVGKNILKEYEVDVRGHYSRHAHAVLREKSADFDEDCRVGLEDLGIMAQEWLYGGNDLKADLFKDSTVDFKDFAMLGEMWLREQPWP
jgi:flavin-dependent dehydrogenase